MFSLKLDIPARLRRLLGKLRTQCQPLVKKRRTYGLSPLGYEFRKTFLTRSGLFLLVTVMLFKIGLAADTYTEQSSRQAALYGAYMDTLAGPMTPQKRQFIEAEYERIQTALHDFDRMRYAFLRGELDGEDYDEFLKEYSYAVDRADSIERIRAHAEYLDTLPEKGVEGGFFFYDLDWERLLSAGADLLLIFYTVTAFSGVFADEYGESGMAFMLRSTKNGREKLFLHKLFFTLAASGVITLLFAGVDALLIATRFKLPAASAPLLSLERFGSISTTLTTAQLLALGTVLRVLSVSLIALLSALLGAIVKSRLYALPIALSVIFLPGLAASLGRKPLGYFDTVRATHLPDLLLQGDSGYVWGFWCIFALLVSALALYAKKEFCK